MQDPVEEGAGVVRDVDSPGLVDGRVQRELDALDEVEDDGVFETAGVGVVVVSEWRRVEDGGGWWRRVEEGGRERRSGSGSGSIWGSTLAGSGCCSDLGHCRRRGGQLRRPW